MNRLAVLRWVNRILFCAIIAVGLYLLMIPILPEIVFRMNQSTQRVSTSSSSVDQQFESKTLPLSASVDEVVVDRRPAPVVDTFSLRIPSIQLENSVGSSSFDSDDLWNGIWHKKRTGDPFNGGNMVVTAHRFLYLGSRDTFYHLPKIQIDDRIYVTWGGQEYEYRVMETFEVTADQVSIEDSTEEHILTLYTCTPLWTSARRFVVRAVPVN